VALNIPYCRACLCRQAGVTHSLYHTLWGMSVGADASARASRCGVIKARSQARKGGARREPIKPRRSMRIFGHP